MFLSEIAVSLLVRLWVEIIEYIPKYRQVQRQPPCEAVSWNTLDEIISITGARQPPCEAVSWNVLSVRVLLLLLCQPPCEAVSWNLSASATTILSFVSLLVRLWVEINSAKCLASVRIVSLLVRLWVEISSVLNTHGTTVRQPPCEAVSWNTLCRKPFSTQLTSASLWGCELK